MFSAHAEWRGLILFGVWVLGGTSSTDWFQFHASLFYNPLVGTDIGRKTNQNEKVIPCSSNPQRNAVRFL